MEVHQDGRSQLACMQASISSMVFGIIIIGIIIIAVVILIFFVVVITVIVIFAVLILSPSSPLRNSAFPHFYIF